MSEFILILIAVILLFSFFRRYIFYFLLRAISERLYRQMKQQQGHPVQGKPEGTVTIDTTNAKQKKRDDDGEYVNYEEIK